MVSTVLAKVSKEPTGCIHLYVVGGVCVGAGGLSGTVLFFVFSIPSLALWGRSRDLERYYLLQYDMERRNWNEAGGPASSFTLSFFISTIDFL